MNSLVVLDSNFYWTRALFGPFSSRMPVLYLRTGDFRNALSAGWKLKDLYRYRPFEDGITQKTMAFPPGWFSRVPGPFMAVLARELRQWKKKTDSNSLITVATFPQYLPVIRRATPDFSIYYWSDNFQTYWPGRSRWVTKLENELVERADLTICCSKSKADELRSELIHVSSKVHCVIHGHYPGLLAQAPSQEARPLPAELSHLKRPILGHWGQVSDNLDFSIVEELSRAFPGASIVFVGPIQDNFSGENRQAYEACRLRPNVWFVGPMPYHRIVEFVPAFDVCLALYRPELEFTRVTNPSKIRDYIATTRPVVTTALPDAISLWSSFLEIGYTREQYVACVGNLLSGEDPKRASLRHEYAIEHTWRLASERAWNLIAGTRGW